ncbi:MAG: allophanate hydrolase, partial [Halioglobus sp.]|nr:allophanate hydrolase [Halioglobus sp.]
MSLDQLIPDIATLQRGYRRGQFTPAEVLEVLLARAGTYREHNVFITCLSPEQIAPWLAALPPEQADELPLYGIPFLIKDNIDLAGVDTTAGCREFAYRPQGSAFIVERLIAAGAIPLGKTNMDQFATGLVGTRSPDYGVCRNSLDPQWISGGSSSGSAVGVALGLASFSLGTDTAGSGRVPAMLNNLYGLKPSRGLLGMSGVVPACRSLDCPSIFALSAADARRVFDVVAEPDPHDPYARVNPFANTARGAGLPEAPLRLGVPRADQRDFCGDTANADLFEETLERWQALGAQLTEVDIAPLLDAARLLYEGPWVAERYAALSDFISAHPQAMDPVVRAIIEPAASLSAVDQWRAEYRMQAFRGEAARMFSALDALLLPTAPTTYTIEALQAEPLALNANMGRYTNFMNLLDLCGVALPAGFNARGQP